MFISCSLNQSLTDPVDYQRVSGTVEAFKRTIALNSADSTGALSTQRASSRTNRCTACCRRAGVPCPFDARHTRFRQNLAFQCSQTASKHLIYIPSFFAPVQYISPKIFLFRMNIVSQELRQRTRIAQMLCGSRSQVWRGGGY